MLLESPSATSSAVGGGTASRDGEEARPGRRFSPPAAPCGPIPPDLSLPATPCGPIPADAEDRTGRLAARRTLLGQIARLERELVEQRCSTWPRTSLELAAQPAGAGHERGARVLGIDQLEALRDALIETLSGERRALARRTLAEEERRRLREELMLDPAANAGARVRNADAGECGCGEVRSEPVGGVLGMLLGWWRVVVSSGCP